MDEGRRSFRAEQGGITVQVVYVDVLLGLNLFINYFLLLSVAKFLRISVRRLRLLAGAAIGAAYSLVILVPMPNILALLCRLAASAVIVLAAFPVRTPKLLLRTVTAFYLVSFAFAGFLLVFWYLTSAQGILIRNSVVYFDISPLVFLAATVLAYGAVRFLQRLTGREAPRALLCRVTATRGEASVTFSARVDTGNSLTEPFSGAPVIVADAAAIAPLIPREEEGCRLVPFHTVSGSGLLRAFRPDDLVIECAGRVTKPPQAYLAVSAQPVSQGEFSALLHPSLLE